MADEASASPLPHLTDTMRSPLVAEWNQSPSAGEADALASEFAQLGSLFEDFLDVTGLPVAISDLSGRVMASSRWQCVCMNFHRAHPTSLERCRVSDAGLTEAASRGGASVSRCANGLTDCATPVVIDGCHVATLYVGQFLTAPPDMDFFRRQQRDFGYDADAYFRALAAVPVVAEERLPAILRLLTSLAEQIGRQALAERRHRAALAAADALARGRTRELAESHERLRKIAARLPGVVYEFVRTAEGRLRVPFASDGIGEMFGVDARALQADADALFDAVLPEDRPALTGSIEQSAATLMPWHHEFRLHRNGGPPRWLSGNAVPERDDGGGTVWHGFVSDVTERRRSEELLQARLRLAERAGQDTLHTLLVATLDEACALTGSATGFYHFLEADQITLSLQAWSTRTTAEFCGATVEDRHYDLDRAGIWADAARQRRSLIINDYAGTEGRKGLPTNHAPVVRLMSVPLLRDGEVKAIIGVGNKATDYDFDDLRVVETLADLAWDLTERKRAEDALAERTALVQRRYESLRALNEIAALPPSDDGDQLRRALDLGAAHLGLPVGILARIDGDDYQVLHHCAPPEAPLADGQHFLLGDTYCALTLQADDVLAIAHMARSPHAGHPCYRAFGLEAYIGAPVTVGGRRFGTLNFSSGEPYPRDFDEGDVDFVRLMARWIGSVIERQQADSALRAAKEAAERSARELASSNADLEQFAYVASHDLRQPLRMVSSYLGLITRRLGDRLDGDIGEFIGYARDGAQQMDRLILDLLEYSRVGRHGEAPSLVDLAEVALEARHLLGVAIEESQGTIEVDTAPALVSGNHSELLRLFQNLMGNALKYRAPERPPVVRVGWRRQDGCWQVSIADNGIGIRPEFLDEIFKIFRRLHTSRDYEGTGIGLAICQKIVKNHHGNIWVESEPGEGSVFHFTLPAS